MIRICLVAAGLAAACVNPVALSTGLTGTVLRGPVQPVCMNDVPCDAPMSADFLVLRSGRPVASFHSDVEGHFKVMLAPGTYVVRLKDGSLIMGDQPKTVTVREDSLTSVQLLFDTGIR